MLDGCLFDTHGGCCLCELSAYPPFEVEERVELCIREERPQEPFGMRTSDSIHTSVALDETHRIPREIVVDDVAALLKVHPLGEDVSAEEQVKAILRMRGQRARRHWSKTVERLLPGD